MWITLRSWRKLSYIQERLYFYSEWAEMTVNWAQALFCDHPRAALLCLFLNCGLDWAGGWPRSGFLLNEAVEKWTEDEGQNHTAAEDHHLFLEKRGEENTGTEREIVLQVEERGKTKPSQYCVFCHWIGTRERRSQAVWSIPKWKTVNWNVVK